MLLLLGPAAPPVVPPAKLPFTCMAKSGVTEAQLSSAGM